MNDENIAQLCNELDKVSQYTPEDNNFTSKWVAIEYKTVVDARARGRPSHRNEYRIIKTLIDARTEVLAKQKNNLEVFVPVCRIIKKIENSVKDVFEQQNSIRDVCEAMDKLISIAPQ